MKVLPYELAAAVSVDRFKREIMLSAALQHPHIVPVLTAGETGGDDGLAADAAAVLHHAVRRGRVAARSARRAGRSPFARR